MLLSRGHYTNCVIRVEFFYGNFEGMIIYYATDGTLYAVLYLHTPRGVLYCTVLYCTGT